MPTFGALRRPVCPLQTLGLLYNQLCPRMNRETSYSKAQIGIAFGIVLALVAFGALVRKPEEIDDKWYGLAANTALVFIVLAYWFRERWRKLSFWICFAVVLAIHFAVYCAILRRADHWPLTYFGMVDIVEWVAFGAIFSRIAGRPRSSAGT